METVSTEGIRALVLRVLTEAKLASDTVFDPDDGCSSLIIRRNDDAALIAVEALAAAGLLPTHEKIRATLERCYATDWRPMPESEAA